MGGFAVYNPFPCKLVIQRQLCGDCRLVEMRAHKMLAAYARGREWFEVDVEVARAAVTAATKGVREELAARRADYLRRAKAAVRRVKLPVDRTWKRRSCHNRR